MKRTQALLVFLLFPCMAYSQYLDTSASFGMRTYPFGASVGAEGGYSWLYYGQIIDAENKTPTLSDYAYGFVRPYARVETSGVVNAAKVGMEIYPISFVKIFAQQMWSHRMTESKAFICGGNNFYCPGPLHQMSFGGEVVASQDEIFGALILKRSRTSAPTREYFEDYYAVLPAADGRDDLWSFTSAIGYDLQEGKKFGFLYSTEKYEGSQARALFRSLFYSQELGPQSVTVLLGLYESTVLPNSVTGALSWKYTFEKGALLP